jgi:maltose alpha-D-glucosyltransferase/alpha-amylase
MGAIELARWRGGRATLAVLQAYVPNEGTAWVHAREELRRYFERVLSRHRDGPAPESPPRSAVAAARAEPPSAIRDVLGSYLDLASLLGRRTADMHLALASNADDPAFTPEPWTTLDRRSKYQSMRNIVGKTLRELRASLTRLPNRALRAAHVLTDNPQRVQRVFEPLLTRRLAGLRIRTHGDYHLEQALYTGKDFVLIDFEGPPLELAERRRKHSPLRDVAGMIRSFHFAAFTAWLDGVVVREEDRELAAPWADAWHRWVSGAFLAEYLDATAGAPFMPGPEEVGLMLDTHLLEKAFAELRDELDRCAESVVIPLDAIVELAGG